MPGRGLTRHIHQLPMGWASTDPLDRGLVNEWRFDPSTGLVLPDARGRTSPGVVSGGTWTTERYGPTLNFDGDNDIVIVSDSPSLDTLTPNITVEIFYRPVSIPVTDTWHGLVNKRDGGSAHFGINWNGLGNQFQVFYNSGGFRIHQAGLTNFSAGTSWYHMVGVYRQDGANTDILVYKNGAFLNSTLGLGGNLLANALDLTMGASWAGNEFANIRLALVRLYSRALSASEVRARYEIVLRRAQPDMYLPWGMAVVAAGVYYQSVAGAWTGSGSVVKATSKPLAGAWSGTGSQIKKISKPLAGTWSGAGSQVKKTSRPLVGAWSGAGTVLKKISKPLAGAWSGSGSLLKKTNKLLAGAWSGSGTILKKISKAVGGAWSGSGSVSKKISKLFAGAWSGSGTVIKKIYKSLAGAWNGIGSLVAQKVGAGSALLMRLLREAFTGEK